ncbi:hypothetical protein PTSG_04578 [Salpingoeca rosetta]|uniref:Uncharacterized protein n=1 Tax=Salpingoeca rosetta (strain ATCC 50818 / BSB-021) TaxID=946362 RepID=F2U7U5_SALR5|nr:uncharacterized protein PTSG_04578 [Salpingoeca rosetta]EGD72850.1 hypothetical protein PTSG_04578 [Salpingoeca rosetta]|eukprot:XP_004994673.1 hypothetical protein PTSG_04578 [Salpingoeca rosetta]
MAKPKVKASIKAQKKKKKTPVHPESRKAKRMNKQYLRKAKLTDQRRSANFKQFKKGIDILWFRQRISNHTRALTQDQLRQLTQEYVKRFDDEIAALERQNKSKHRQMMLSERSSHEKSLFQSTYGITVPDLTDPENVRKLFSQAFFAQTAT